MAVSSGTACPHAGVGSIAVGPLVQMLEEGNPLAALVLGKMDEACAAPAPVQALGSDYAPVRYRSAEALGRFGDSMVVPSLIAARGRLPEDLPLGEASHTRS